MKRPHEEDGGPDNKILKSENTKTLEIPRSIFRNRNPQSDISLQLTDFLHSTYMASLPRMEALSRNEYVLTVDFEVCVNC